jgi:hypothetical protein
MGDFSAIASCQTFNLLNQAINVNIIKQPLPELDCSVV